MSKSEFGDVRDLRPMLVIDTSSGQGGVALFDGQLLSTRSWPADRSHTTTVLAEVHHLLESAELDIADIGVIGVATGPGAFTGLRVGFGVAKGLHLATGAALIGVSTLRATALPFAACGKPVVATVGAGRGRLVWSHYEGDQTSLLETRSPRNGTAEELAAELTQLPYAIVAGELDASQEVILVSAGHALLPPRALRMRSPAAIAELAWQRWQQGEIDDPAHVEPVYLSR